MRPTRKDSLAKAVVVQMRVLADLASRWFARNGEDDGRTTGCAAAWTRHGVLVVIANGEYADSIAGELERAHLLEPQRDKEEHLHPEVAA